MSARAPAASFVLALLGACAASGSPAQGRPVDPRLAPPESAAGDPAELALFVSGYEAPKALAAARKQLEAAVLPIVERARRERDPEARARALLRELHRAGVLGVYEARATTLAELLEAKRFNCVSASVLYNVLAERLDLRAAGQLLPTHARSIVYLGERAVVVETTSPHGFAPDARTQARILEQVALPDAQGRRALVSDQGVIVSTPVLMGAMYVNRGSIAQEAGDLPTAEALFQRAEAMAADQAMRQVLRDQRAALLSQLAADDIASGDLERLRRAYRTTVAAVQLAPRDPEVRRVTQQNLRASAERLIARAGADEDEGEIERVRIETERYAEDAAHRAGLRAFALSEVARLAAEQGRFDRAIEAIEAALAERLEAQDRDLQGTLQQNLYATLRLAAASEARAGNLDRGLQLIERLIGDPALTRDQREAAVQDKLHLRLVAAQQRYQAGDHAGAAALYRAALREFPADATARHNLIASLERLAAPEVNAGRCAAAAALLDELRRLDPKNEYVPQAQLRCAVTAANDRLTAGDHDAAADLLRTARRALPAEAILAKNLSVVLIRWARVLESGGACREARSKMDEARAIAAPGFSASDFALSRCR